jgi:hypothetical protein
MVFRYFYRKRVLVWRLVLGFFFVFSATAQTPPPSLKDLGIKLLDIEGLPASRALHLPESSISRATIGTISGDGDNFMSVLEWGSIEDLTRTFVLAGVDEYGLSLGYAKKLGRLYLGGSYSGSLIEELFRRVTNQDVVALKRKTTIGDNSYSTGLFDLNGQIPPGETISNNDINLILGAGVFGLRLGFAQWVRAVEFSSSSPYWARERTLESSLKPSLELGFNFMAGPVRVKPALRVAFDMHEYDSNTGVVKDDTTTTPGSITSYWVIHDDLINFYEPSAGFTLGFDFVNSNQASAELIFDGDAAYRMYRSRADADSLHSTWYYDTNTAGYPDFPLDLTTPPTNTIDYKATIPLDLRITAAPRFVGTRDFGSRFTLGAKIELGAGYDLLMIEQEDQTAQLSSSSYTSLTIKPDFSIGGSVHLIPDHFSIHAGLGLVLFSFREVTTESETAGTADPKETTRTIDMPSARFASGITLNFTKAVAMDLMTVSSGLSLDNTKFTLLFTVKR